jgi:hypothetical protein
MTVVSANPLLKLTCMVDSGPVIIQLPLPAVIVSLDAGHAAEKLSGLNNKPVNKIRIRLKRITLPYRKIC